MLLYYVGGVRGVLARMDTHKCKPDIKTFFYLLRALSLEEKNEQELLTVMKVMPAQSDFATYIIILVMLYKVIILQDPLYHSFHYILI